MLFARLPLDENFVLLLDGRGRASEFNSPQFALLKCLHRSLRILAFIHN